MLAASAASSSLALSSLSLALLDITDTTAVYLEAWEYRSTNPEKAKPKTKQRASTWREPPACEPSESELTAHTSFSGPPILLV